MKPMTVTAALVLALAGAACSQETPPASDAAPELAEASTPAEAPSGFNLMIPGSDDTDTSSTGGFNLSLPGDETEDVLLPENSISESTFGDADVLPSPEPLPEAEPADEIIRLDSD